MANTIASALYVDTVEEIATTALANRLAFLRLFSTNHSTAVGAPRSKVQVPLATAGSTTSTNPTSFNSVGASTLGAAEVSLDHVYQPFGLENVDVLKGSNFQNLIKVNMQAFANKLWEISTTPITVANYGAATITIADSAMTPSSGNAAKLWAGVSKSRTKGLILNPGMFSNLIPTNTQGLMLTEGAYGFENGVHYATSFPSEAKLAGFACSPEAVAIATAQPNFTAIQNYATVMESVELPDLGVTVYYNVWNDPATRSIIGSLEVMLGSAKGITSGTVASVYNP